MVLYNVVWLYSNDLAKGKGRCTDLVTGFTVLCRNSHDALNCLDYHFHHHYKSSNVFDIEDGEVKLSRCKIDSRNFNANYLMMDGIKEPIELSDLKSSLLRLSRFFYGH